jgi:hypothetical protein
MSSEHFVRRRHWTGADSKLKDARVFIEAQSNGGVARWAEVHLTESFSERFELLHQLLLSQNLTSVECLVPVVWKLADGWVTDSDSTMSVWTDGVTFKNDAHPADHKWNVALRHEMHADVFLEDIEGFISDSRSTDVARWDDVVVNPAGWELDYETYREATIDAMTTDRKNNLICRVNTHLLGSALPVLRRRKPE